MLLRGAGKPSRWRSSRAGAGRDHSTHGPVPHRWPWCHRRLQGSSSRRSAAGRRCTPGIPAVHSPTRLPPGCPRAGDHPAAAAHPHPHQQRRWHAARPGTWPVQGNEPPLVRSVHGVSDSDVQVPVERVPFPVAWLGDRQVSCGRCSCQPRANEITRYCAAGTARACRAGGHPGARGPRRRHLRGVRIEGKDGRLLARDRHVVDVKQFPVPFRNDLYATVGHLDGGLRVDGVCRALYPGGPLFRLGHGPVRAV